MKEHVEKMLKHSVNNLGGDERTSPAGEHSFDVRKEAKRLDDNKKQTFHTMTAKVLFLCKNARPDLQPTITFSSTRAREPDEDDWKKPVRTMQHLILTTDSGLALDADNHNVIEWHIDAVHAAHLDMKGHAGTIKTSVIPSSEVWNLAIVMSWNVQHWKFHSIQCINCSCGRWWHQHSKMWCCFWHHITRLLWLPIGVSTLMHLFECLEAVSMLHLHVKMLVVPNSEVWNLVIIVSWSMQIGTLIQKQHIRFLFTKEVMFTVGILKCGSQKPTEWEFQRVWVSGSEVCKKREFQMSEWTPNDWPPLGDSSQGVSNFNLIMWRLVELWHLLWNVRAIWHMLLLPLEGWLFQMHWRSQDGWSTIWVVVQVPTSNKWWTNWWMECNDQCLPEILFSFECPHKCKNEPWTCWENHQVCLIWNSQVPDFFLAPVRCQRPCCAFDWTLKFCIHCLLKLLTVITRHCFMTVGRPRLFFFFGLCQRGVPQQAETSSSKDVNARNNLCLTLERKWLPLTVAAIHTMLLSPHWLAGPVPGSKNLTRLSVLHRQSGLLEVGGDSKGWTAVVSCCHWWVGRAVTGEGVDSFGGPGIGESSGWITCDCCLFFPCQEKKFCRWWVQLVLGSFSVKVHIWFHVLMESIIHIIWRDFIGVVNFCTNTSVRLSQWTLKWWCRHEQTMHSSSQLSWRDCGTLLLILMQMHSVSCWMDLLCSFQMWNDTSCCFIFEMFLIVTHSFLLLCAFLACIVPQQNPHLWKVCDCTHVVWQLRILQAEQWGFNDNMHGSLSFTAITTVWHVLCFFHECMLHFTTCAFAPFFSASQFNCTMWCFFKSLIIMLLLVMFSLPFEHACCIFLLMCTLTATTPIKPVPLKSFPHQSNMLHHDSFHELPTLWLLHLFPFQFMHSLCSMEHVHLSLSGDGGHSKPVAFRMFLGWTVSGSSSLTSSSWKRQGMSPWLGSTDPMALHWITFLVWWLEMSQVMALHLHPLLDLSPVSSRFAVWRHAHPKPPPLPTGAGRTACSSHHRASGFVATVAWTVFLPVGAYAPYVSYYIPYRGRRKTNFVKKKACNLFQLWGLAVRAMDGRMISSNLAAWS